MGCQWALVFSLILTFQHGRERVVDSAEAATFRWVRDTAHRFRHNPRIQLVGNSGGGIDCRQHSQAEHSSCPSTRRSSPPIPTTGGQTVGPPSDEQPQGNTCKQHRPPRFLAKRRVPATKPVAY